MSPAALHQPKAMKGKEGREERRGCEMKRRERKEDKRKERVDEKQTESAHIAPEEEWKLSSFQRKS